MPADRDAFRRLSEGKGFRRIGTRIVDKEVHVRVVGCRLLYLDVHFGFVQRGLTYLRAGSIGDRVRRTSRGHHALTPEDELLHLFFHSLVGKRRLQEKHLARVAELAGSRLDREYIDSQLTRRGEREWFARFRANPGSFVDDDGPAGRAAREITSSLHRSSFRNAWNAFRFGRLNRWLHTRRGVHIAFVGVDGSGKTTTLENVKRLLAQNPTPRCREVYMGPWGHVRSSLLKRVYELKLFPPRDSWSSILMRRFRGDRTHSLALILRKLAFGTVKGTVYYAAVYYELWHRYLREIRPALKKRAIVLSDRYICDLRFIYKKRRMTDFGLLRAFVCRFFPRPDLLVFLHNEPAVIASRKDQLSADQIGEMQEAYRVALASYPVLDCVTDRPPEPLAREIVRQILDRYVTRVR